MQSLPVSCVFLNSSEGFDTPYSTVSLQTLLRVDDSLHFDTLLLNLLYEYFDQCWASTYLLNTLDLLTNFLSKSAELTRQLSAPQCSARISSVRVTRFLFPPSHNSSDVAFKLLTMLTFLNTVFLPDSVSTELHNFLLTAILAHIDLNSPRGESLLSTPTLGTLRFALPHSLALQASSLLLDVTPIRHLVHAIRSLSTPWKSQRLPQRFFSFASVSLFWTQSLTT